MHFGAINYDDIKNVVNLRSPLLASVRPSVRPSVCPRVIHCSFFLSFVRQPQLSLIPTTQKLHGITQIRNNE